MSKAFSVQSLFEKLKSFGSDRPGAHEEVSRLKQIENRSQTKVKTDEARRVQDAVADKQRVTVKESALRWSNNPDRGMKQEIRQHHQMGGVEKAFEIDPMLGLQ